MKRLIIPLIALSLMTGPVVASNTVTVKMLTTNAAQKIANATLAYCAEEGYQVTAVVASRDGRAQVMLRHALASPMSIKLAGKKATTAAVMRQESEAVSEILVQNSQGRLTRMRGGVPIEIGGHFYGGVGVSGATSEIDKDCAEAGIQALADELEFED